MTRTLLHTINPPVRGGTSGGWTSVPSMDQAPGTLYPEPAPG